MVFPNLVFSQGPSASGRYKRVLASGLIPVAEMAIWDISHFKFQEKEQ